MKTCRAYSSIVNPFKPSNIRDCLIMAFAGFILGFIAAFNI